ncbi:hypothetical protein STENM327S_05539 [Streptomyces tendae]
MHSSAIKIRACSQVNPDRRTATFGMQVWNTGVKPVTVSTMVKQFRSGAQADCPGMSSPRRKIDINPGDSWWSDLSLCGAEGLDFEPFQAVAYAVEDPAGNMDPTSPMGVNSISLTLNDKGQVLCKYGNAWTPSERTGRRRRHRRLSRPQPRTSRPVASRRVASRKG